MLALALFYLTFFDIIDFEISTVGPAGWTLCNSASWDGSTVRT